MNDSELVRIVNNYCQFDGIQSSDIAGLHFYKMFSLNVRLPVVYRPSIYMVVQGDKQVILNKEAFKYTRGQFLVVSVDLPLIGEVTKASKDEPYLCIQVDIDAQIMSELAVELNANNWSSNTKELNKSIFVGNTDSSLQDAILRLVRLLDTPQDIPYLSELFIKEIHYRLLTSRYGYRVIQTYLRGSKMHRISKTIEVIKTNFAKPLNVSELAQSNNMSTSNFYTQFKKITGLSPLQYLKQVRLTEARQMMLSKSIDASKAAYLVGYESASQFSREYSRLFGAPPYRDIKAYKQMGT